MENKVHTMTWGVSLGSTLAITVSYAANHSILWAIVHGFLSWFYVLYFICCK